MILRVKQMHIDHDDDINRIVTNGLAVISELYHKNESNKDEELSSKIIDICISAKKIYDCIEEYPEKSKKLHLFHEFYFKSTVDIIENYWKKFKNSESKRRKIIDFLDKINHSFTKQYENLFQLDSITLETEIEVLKKSLKAEGLLE